jgi:glyoxylase-like metal-dependent hydrolase (beta-lactamase superfamily II)
LSIAQLPESIAFIERDWLSANHVMFRDGDAVTLIDSGYGKFNGVTLERVATHLQAWDRTTLNHIINTHIHSDHIGGNAALQRAYPGCTITIPAEEEAALLIWDSDAQMLTYADQQAERFQWNAMIDAGATITLGGELWESIATPGHDMGSLVFYCQRLRILISADALWENGFGFVLPQAIDPRPLAAQRATFSRMAQLDVALVIPGHGPMFTDYTGALKRASEKLEAFAQDDMKIVRNVAKGMFIYSMMWRGTMALNALTDYVSSVPVHRDYNAQFFKMSDEAYARWLIDESVRAGKIRVVGDMISVI